MIAASAEAQDPQAAARVERARTALAPVANLVGRWEGEATAMIGPGQSRRITQLEDVVWGASRTVIFIRGTGLSTDAATRGDTIFEAAAAIWVDEASGALRMRTHRDGRLVEPTVEIRPDTIVWGFPVPGGRIEYTIALTPNTWHEVGDFIREGVAPIRTIDMRLRRVRP